MASFDNVYNDQCAELWSPSEPVQYVAKFIYLLQTWAVMAKRGGLSTEVGTFATKEEAQAYADKLTLEAV